jgi:chromate transporter
MDGQVTFMTFLTLIVTFFILGFITFGGGMVAVTLLYDQFVTSGYLSETTYYYMLTIAESTPGPIAINLATYLGVQQLGIFGGVVTTLAFVLPSVALLWLILPWFDRYRQSPSLMVWMTWVRAMVFGLILVTIVRIGLSVVTIIQPQLYLGLGFLLTMTSFLPTIKNRPYVLIAFGAVFGLIFL